MNMKTNIKAEFKVFNTNAKGQVSIGLVLKGELSDAQILALHRMKAAGLVFVDLYDGQASIEDYDHDDTTSEEPQEQLTIETLPFEPKQDELDDELF